MSYFRKYYVYSLLPQDLGEEVLEENWIPLKKKKRELKPLWAKYKTVFLWLFVLANKQTYREFILIIRFCAVFLGDLNSPFYVTCLVRVVYIFIFFNYFKVTVGKCTVGKCLELKDKFDLCDIWRINHPKTKTFTFRQKHFSGFIQWRLDSIFVLQNLQEKTRNADNLNTVSIDDLPVFCSLLNSTEFPKGPGIWKVNNSIIFDCNFVKEMKCYIHDTKTRLVIKHVFDQQS